MAPIRSLVMVVAGSTSGTDCVGPAAARLLILFSSDLMLAGGVTIAGDDEPQTRLLLSSVLHSCISFPGVTSLQALLSRGRDEDLPQLNILLCESLVATYTSLFVHALATFDASVLYRLTAHSFSANLWSILFGGGLAQKVTVITKADEQRKCTVLSRVNS